MSAKKADLFYLSLILLLAAALRLDFLIANSWSFDSDEAIVGLMAKHMAEGVTFPIFYYGQHYMGSLEPLLVSWLGEFIGINQYSLKLVPLFFSLIFIVLSFSIARKVFNRTAAYFAAIWLAIPPVSLTIWSSMARGGFIEVICIGALAILILIDGLRKNKLSLIPLVKIAFVLGAGWWVNNQIIYFIIPIFITILFHTLRRNSIFITIQLFFISIGAFLIGSLPFWIYNLREDFASFQIFNGSGSNTSEYLANFFSLSVPTLLAARTYGAGHDLYPNSSLYVYLIYGILCGVVLIQQSPQIVKFFTTKVEENSGLVVVLLLMISVAGVFVNTSFGHLSLAPRYLLPIYLPFSVIFGAAWAILYRHSRILSLTIFLIAITINLLSNYYPSRNTPGEAIIYKSDRASHNNQELIDWLSQNNISWIKTNYWIGYKIAFETSELVRFTQFAFPLRARIEEYQRLGENQPEVYVLVDSQYQLVKRALKALHYDYQHLVKSNYHIIYDLVSLDDLKQRKEVKIIDLEIEATHNAAAIGNIIDNNLATRWGSAHPQSEDMAIRIKFNDAQILDGLYFDLGNWKTDFARSLVIKLVDDLGNVRKLIGQKDYQAVSYFRIDKGRCDFYFPKEKVKEIIFEQKGSDPFFDWSIAEIGFYR